MPEENKMLTIENDSRTMKALPPIKHIYIGNKRIKYAEMKDIQLITYSNGYEKTYNNLEFYHHVLRYQTGIQIANDAAHDDSLYDFNNVEGLKELYSEYIDKYIDETIIGDLAEHAKKAEAVGNLSISQLLEKLTEDPDVKTWDKCTIFISEDIVKPAEFQGYQFFYSSFFNSFLIGKFNIVLMKPETMENKLGHIDFIAVNPKDLGVCQIVEDLKVINPDKNQTANAQYIYDRTFFDVVYKEENPRIIASITGPSIASFNLEPEAPKKARKKKQIEKTE